MNWIDNSEAADWQNGSFNKSYTKFGAHLTSDGCWFCVWAPNAESISVVGDFNNWTPHQDHLEKGEAGIWTGFISTAQAGHRYKYHIKRGAYEVDKSDPYAFYMEAPNPQGSHTDGLASIIADLDTYSWNDEAWIKQRKGPSDLNTPISIYEVHLGSWRRNKDGYSMNFREIAQPLAEYVSELGFTHIEVMPLMEHPYFGSWGYQTIGYYAPTHRYGKPEDLKYFVDYMHQQGIGVILDWVPAHFATDPQGLVFYDGSTLFEYDDPRMRFHPDWGTYVFDYGKPQVRNFLISNALFWMEEYHMDGLRFDAVASLLYRDYSRTEWTPNIHGGRENLEAIEFLRTINERVYAQFPEALMIAEESTAWPGVSQPTYNNGLGFLYKWNMGWMHDTLKYMDYNPIHRQYHQNELTFPLLYAFSENFILPLSHDEVVHGKGSLWGKMPGDDWQKAANLRLLYGHMYGHPGKKLLFMGAEFGQTGEWSYNHTIDWPLLEKPLHKGIFEWLKALNHLYKTHPAMWADGSEHFAWIDHHDHQHSIVSYKRTYEDEQLVFVFNYTPVPREQYPQGFPEAGTWKEVLNSDAALYGGGDVGNGGSVVAKEDENHHQPASALITIPPMGVMIFEKEA